MLTELEHTDILLNRMIEAITNLREATEHATALHNGKLAYGTVRTADHLCELLDEVFLIKAKEQEWICDICNYHNLGPVCTKCGRIKNQ